MWRQIQENKEFKKLQKNLKLKSIEQLIMAMKINDTKRIISVTIIAVPESTNKHKSPLIILMKIWFMNFQFY